MKPGFLEVIGHYPEQLRMLSDHCNDEKTARSAVHCLEIDGKYCLVAFSGSTIMYRFIEEMLQLGFEVGKSYYPKKQNGKLCWYVEVTDEIKEEEQWVIPPLIFTSLSNFKQQETTGEFYPSSDLMPLIKIIPTDYYVGVNDLLMLSGSWVVRRDTDRIIYQAGQLYIFTVLKSYED